MEIREQIARWLACNHYGSVDAWDSVTQDSRDIWLDDADSLIASLTAEDELLTEGEIRIPYPNYHKNDTPVFDKAFDELIRAQAAKSALINAARQPVVRPCDSCDTNIIEAIEGEVTCFYDCLSWKAWRESVKEKKS